MIGETPYFEVTSDEFLDPIHGPIKDKEGFFKRILEFIEYNINTSYKITVLCYLVGPTGTVMEATLEDEGYYKSLKKCLSYYEKVEEYEKCVRIKQLIQLYEL